MPNIHQLNNLRQGSIIWNAWQKSNNHLDIDLDETDLKGPVDLEGCIFICGNIKNARFENINFRNSDFSRCDISGTTFINCQLVGVNFGEANLRNARSISSSFDGAIFAGADLTDADFTASEMRQADFSKAILSSTNFEKANLSQSKNIDVKQLAKCVLKGSTLNNIDLSGIDLSGLNLTDTKFQSAILTRADLSKTILVRADLSGAKIQGADLTSAEMNDCIATHAIFNDANFARAKCIRSNFGYAFFDSANFLKTNLEEANLNQASFLHAKNIDKAVNLAWSQCDMEIRYFDKLEFSKFNTFASWEMIRNFGRLPLFGASYTALISISFFFYFLGFYDEKVKLLRQWASDSNSGSIGRFIIDNVRPEDIPTRSLLILVASVSLAVASTIYALSCPSRVKEFSLEQWRHELKRPVFHYVAKSWEKPFLRGVTLFFYLVGGSIGALVLTEKMLLVLKFIIYHDVSL